MNFHADENRKRLQNMRRVSAWIVVVLIFLCSDSSAEMQDGDAVLSKMRAFDSSFLAGVTISGRGVLQPNPLDVAFEPTPTKWKLTLAGDGQTAAMSIEALRVPQVSSSAVDEWRKKSNEPAYRRPSLEVRRTLYFGPERMGEVIAVANLEDIGQPGSSINDSRLQYLSQIYPGNNRSLELPMKKALWSMGRGFAQHLDKIVDLKSLEGGRLSVTARGNALGSKSGTWKLEIEPNEGYMVRAASFVLDGQDAPQIDITNKGIRRDGARWVPMSATWKEPFGGANVPLDTETVSSSVDDNFIAQAKQLMTGPFPGPSTILDYINGGPHTVQLKANQEYIDPISAVGLDAIRNLGRDGPVMSTDAARVASVKSASAGTDAVGITTNPPLASSPRIQRWLLSKTVAVRLIAAALILLLLYVVYRRRREPEKAHE